MRLWMICYDISNAARRRQIAAALADAGASHVQESVFEGWFVRRDLVALYAQLARVVGEDGGSLRAYPLSIAHNSRSGLGNMPLPTKSPGSWLC
jgi:CRISPR-associated endonuclease Cas2